MLVTSIATAMTEQWVWHVCTLASEKIYIEIVHLFTLNLVTWKVAEPSWNVALKLAISIILYRHQKEYVSYTKCVLQNRTQSAAFCASAESDKFIKFNCISYSKKHILQVDICEIVIMILHFLRGKYEEIERVKKVLRNGYTRVVCAMHMRLNCYF